MIRQERFMQRAIELAKLGAGRVSPNPLVGCVITHDDKIIGEGWHRKYGEPHAEVNALESVGNAAQIKDAELYVTLEPCSHYGKTPPCADRLIEEKIKKVYIGSTDPNPVVAGKGIQRLTDANIPVVNNILKAECQALNRRFFTFIQAKRPYITLKWAQTADGFIARKDFSSQWISGPSSRQLVHQWRAEEDAVMVGYHTAYHDNPSLTVRQWHGRNPVRIFFDRTNSLPEHFNLKDGSARTICITESQHLKPSELRYVQLMDVFNLEAVLTHLYQENIQSILVEGGAVLLDRFMQSGLWDEARIFQSPGLFHAGIAAPLLKGRISRRLAVDKDFLTYWINPHSAIWQNQ
jgi:diaminohydroxyphosphoribosylaminopyrimidine deaminase/5-amino-6-(5-phosphoribosylamino)uracil reductase